MTVPGVHPGAQSVVFDNTTTYLHKGMPLLSILRKDSAEMGDEVRLAGDKREIVELRIRFWYSGTTPCSFDARVRLRPLQEGTATPGPAVVEAGKIVGYRPTEIPGETIYDSGLIVGLEAVAGMNEYTFTIPRIKAPDRIVWTIEAHSRDVAGELGPAYYDPPTVGSSEDFFWHSDHGSPWIAYSWGGYPVANFGARLVAADK